jgi:hypothetical protein
MADKMVPNPKLAALKQLRAKWAAQHDTVKAALDRPARDFGGGTVISGPWRDEMAPEITGRKDKVSRLADEVLSAIDRAIQAEPAEVTEAEARYFRQMRRGNL